MADQNFRDLARMIRLEAEEVLDDKAPAIINHIKETALMAKFWAVVFTLHAVVYTAVASLEYRMNPGAAETSAVFSWFYVVSVGVMLIGTVLVSVSTARIALYSAILAISEAVILPIVNVGYTIAASLIPDLIERGFGMDKLEDMLRKAQEDKQLKQTAQKLIRGYAHIVAWELFVPWFLMTLPLVVFAHPTVVIMVVIGIVILIYQVVGFETEAYWYNLIQQGSMYAVATYIILNMVIMPVVRASGVFEGWGPPSYWRTAFWLAVILGAAALVFAGVRVTKDETTKKTSFSVKKLNVGIAAVIIVVAAVFGNLALTTLASAGREQSNVPGDHSTSTAGSSNPAPVNTAAGPYYRNTDSDLVSGKAYKFASNNRVYIYEGGKLRPVANEQAYFSYYGCPGGQRVIDCAPVYEMPGSINPGSNILKGEMIN